MSQKEKDIMETFKEVLPEMSDFSRGWLTGYGERILEMKKKREAGADRQQGRDKPEAQTA